MKRLCALLLCTALMFPSALALSDPVWPQWAEQALSWAQEAGISQSFLSAPEQVVTRGMAAQLLYESAGRPAVSEACPFSDVSGDYADAVTWAAGQGCLTGVGNGRYEPERPVTRQEFAAILWRRAACPAAPVQGLDAFSDAGATAEWARSAILWCLQTDVMRGRSGGLMAPLDQITVAEAAAMLQRSSQLPEVSSLRADLAALTGAPQPIGSQGEATPSST